MKKIISLLTALLLIVWFVPGSVYAAEMPDITAQSAILIDSVSREIICEKNSHEKMYPASMTKIMTMLLVMENIASGKISLSDKVCVTEEATSLGGTQLFLETGEVRTVEELLYGTAVESANDAATALGIHIAGSLEGFASMMNEKAKTLGMNDTHFINACGLHEDGHYTSAYDMAILSAALLGYEDILKYTSTWTIDVYIGKNNDRLRSLANTNKLISRYDNIDGLKTGYTEESGHCMSATGKISDTRLIAVVMKSRDANARFDDAKKLLDYGFSLYEGTFPVKSGDILGDIPVRNGKTEYAEVAAKDDIYAFGEKGKFTDLRTELIFDEDIITAPVDMGIHIGTAEVYSGDRLIGKTEIITAESVEKCTLGEYLKRIVSVVMY